MVFFLSFFKAFYFILEYIQLTGGSAGKKKSTCNVGTWVWSPGWEDPLEKGIGTHSSILAWRIPWTV